MTGGDPRRAIGAAAGLLGVVAVAWLAIHAAVDHGVLTTYAGASGWQLGLELTAVVLLAAPAAASLARGGRAGAAVAALAAATCVMATDLAGWEEGSRLARTAGLVGGALIVPLVVTAACRSAGASRAITARVPRAVWVIAGVAAAVALASYDPFTDPRCWANCSANLLTVDGDAGVARAAYGVLAATSLGAALAMLACVRGARSPIERASLIIGAALAATLGAAGIARLSATESAHAFGFGALHAATGSLAAALGVVLALEVRRATTVRDALGQLARDVGAAPPPGTLEAALRRAVGDPGLRLLYAGGPDGAWVDGDGAPAAALVAPDETSTPVSRAGRAVALLIHDPTAPGAVQLDAALGPVSRLAIENEALRAGARAQLAELQASRMRIVQRADAERRRLERNLHDGAQQRLIGIALALQLAGEDARAAGDEPLAGRLDALRTRLRTTLDELRAIAEGIHPVALTDEGLAPALRLLAERAPVPVAFSALPDRRLPAPIESAVYAVVSEVIADAAQHAGGPQVAVAIRQCGDKLDVTAGYESPSVNGHAVAGELADRVGALGGRLLTDDALPTRTTVRAVLPLSPAGAQTSSA